MGSSGLSALVNINPGICSEKQQQIHQKLINGLKCIAVITTMIAGGYWYITQSKSGSSLSRQEKKRVDAISQTYNINLTDRHILISFLKAKKYKDSYVIQYSKTQQPGNFDSTLANTATKELEHFESQPTSANADCLTPMLYAIAQLLTNVAEPQQEWGFKENLPEFLKEHTAKLIKFNLAEVVGYD